MPSGRPSATERVQQRPLEVLAEGRLPRDAARLLEADRRRDDRLVRAALGRERHAGRRADEDRLPARVHAERPRLERPVDERVVHRPDRQQRPGRRATRSPRARRAARPGCPPRCPSSMCWPCSCSRQWTSVSLSSANQSIRSPRCQMPARLIQPPRLVDDATSGLTVTTCARHLGRARGRGRRRSGRTPAGSRRCPRGALPTSAGPAARLRRARAPAARRRSRARGEQPPASAEPSAKGAHGSPASAPSCPASSSHWSSVSSAEWLAGWPSVGSRHALIV